MKTRRKHCFNITTPSCAKKEKLRKAVAITVYRSTNSICINCSAVMYEGEREETSLTVDRMQCCQVDRERRKEFID